ncbi:hypothetical protein tb265_25750 [Gemmatimonadetes bacterium T265]|nr:hypothetical protein tb265_25750 [Gemmatimonadetes bacterium T265]
MLAVGAAGGATAEAQSSVAQSPTTQSATAPSPAADSSRTSDAARRAGLRPVQLRPGDVVKLYVWREPEMSRDYEVNGDGAIDLPKLGLVTVADVSPDSLRRALEVRYARYLRTPTVEVSMRRRISVLGSVRNPGVYQVDPYVSVADALALAGGVTPEARTDEVRVLRGDQTLRTRVSTRTIIADSPVQSGDQLYVPDRGWVSRNLTLISAAVSAVGILVFALNR